MNEYFIKLPIRLWWLTALLISVNVALFALEVFNGVNITNPTGIQLIRWGADFAPLTLSSDSWRLISSVFLHIGIVHLLVNMWALYLFGVYSEFYYGRWFYVLLYLAAGIAGNLLSNYLILHATLQSLNTANHVIPIVGAGASGAIMGVGGALMVAAFWPKSDLPTHYRLNKNALIILMAINLSLGFFVEGINSAAHLGGFIAGVILALGFRFSLLLPALAVKLTQIMLIFVSFVLLYWIYNYLSLNAERLNILWSNFRF